MTYYLYQGTRYRLKDTFKNSVNVGIGAADIVAVPMADFLATEEVTKVTGRVPHAQLETVRVRRWQRVMD